MTRKTGKGPTARPRVLEKPREAARDVLIGYLTRDEIAGNFQKSFIDSLVWDVTNDMRIGRYIPMRTAAIHIAKNRNTLCQELLDGREQWLWMVDSDMGWEANTLDRMLAAADPEKYPVMGALAFMLREVQPDGLNGMDTFPAPTLFTYQEDTDGYYRFRGVEFYPMNTRVKVGATGGACLLIHRSVLERIRDEFGPVWFSQIPDPNPESRDFMGEDVSFCERCRLLDIPLTVHTGIRTNHFKSFWLGEADHWNARTPHPAEERCDVIVPTLGQRPENIPRLLKSLRATTGMAKAFYVVEPGDQETINEVTRYGGFVIECAGSFAKKVNYAYRELEGSVIGPAPWLLLVGDDVSFRSGWLDWGQNIAKMFDGKVIATNDLLNPRVIRGEHATHPLIRRDYIDEVGASWDGPGVVCHEGYTHCFVDDEITNAAKMRGVFQAAYASYVPHWHPIGGEVKEDEVYRQGMAHFADDKRLFQQRFQEAMAGRIGVGSSHAVVA